MKEISVIIPYHNKFERFKYSLESLNQQDFQGEYQVIVIDDGSEIHFEKLIKDTQTEILFDLRVISTENRGRSSARNTGISAAEGNLILFMDDDVILPSDLLRIHYEHHMRQKEDIFVHSKVVEDITALMAEDFSEKTVNRDLMSKGRRGKIQHRYSILELLLQKKSKNVLEWCGFIGNNVSVKREVLKKVGGFNEDFVGWGFEDFDMGYRLIRSGVKFMLDDSCVIHLSHKRGINHSQEMDNNFERFYKMYDDDTIKGLYLYLTNRIDVEGLFQMINDRLQIRGT